MTVFIVKNTSVQKKTITVFGLSLAYNNSTDLMLLANVTENVIADSLLKGELKTKINSGDLVVVQSTVLIPSADSTFTTFLVSCGIGDSVHPEQSHGFLTQATWYIDPVNGRDNKDGKTAAKAIKTFAELNRRLGPPGTILSPNNPTVAPWDNSIFTGNVGNIYLLGDLPDADQINWQYTLATDCRFIVHGTKKVIGAASSSFTAAPENKNSAINQPYTITDSARNWWTLKGKMVEILTGPGAGSRAYVARPYTDKITVAVPGSIGEEYFIAATTPATPQEIRVEAAAMTAHSVALLLSAELTARGFANTVAGAVITLTVPSPTVFPLSENTTMTAKKAHVSEWCSGDTPDPFGYGSANLPSDAPAMGSTYRVLDLSSVVPGTIETNGNELNTSCSLTFVYVKFKQLSNASINAVGGGSVCQLKSNQFAQLQFGDCIFDMVALDLFPGGVIEGTNCCYYLNNSIYCWTASAQFHTCTFLSKAPCNYPSAGILPQPGAWVDINGCCTFVGIPGPWDYGSPDINGDGLVLLGDVSFWDCSAHALVTQHGAYFTHGYQGKGDTWHGDPTPRIWGKGMQSHMFFFEGSQFRMEQFQFGDVFAPPVLPAWENYLGPGGTVIEQGSNQGGEDIMSKANVFDPLLGTFGPPVDITWAAFDVAAPAGFKSPEFQDSGPWGAYYVSVARAVRPDIGNHVSFSYGRYERPPEIDAVTPNNRPALGGTSVTITALPSTQDEYHMEYRTGVIVEFGTYVLDVWTATPATSVVLVDGQTITCVVPAHAAGAVMVRVTNPSGAWTESDFTYT
jgi:hypothetical protein